MDRTTGLAIEEQEHRAPARARNAQNGGGVAGPSTVKGEKRRVLPKN